MSKNNKKITLVMIDPDIAALIGTFALGIKVYNIKKNNQTASRGNVIRINE
jgi:hypothetical protein